MNAPAKLPTRKCRICRDPYVQFNSLKPTCGKYECQVAFGLKHAEKAEAARSRKERKETREAKLRIKTLRQWLKEVEYWCNKAVRLRDKDEPCISCGTTNPNIQYAAGHFRTVKAAPQLRFNLDNIHKQCNYHCNSQLSGNRENYDPRLVKKIGQERVDVLKNNNEIKRYTIEECKELIIYFKQMCKELQQ